MSRSKERKQYNLKRLRFIITILLLVAFVLTTTSFAYFASDVEGTNTTATSTFSVGFPLFESHEFVLDDNLVSYTYIVPVDELLVDPVNNTDEVLFGIIWDNPDLLDEYLNQDVSAAVEVSYEIHFTKNGRAANSSTYYRLLQLINIEMDVDNPTLIDFNDSAESFGFTVSLNDPGYFNDYSLLARYETSITITYTIDESNIIIND